MTNFEAQEKARSLYGFDAQVEERPDGYFQISLGEPRETWEGWPPRLALGIGKSWEEALAEAAERLEKYELVRRDFEKWRATHQPGYIQAALL